MILFALFFGSLYCGPVICVVGLICAVVSGVALREPGKTGRKTLAMVASIAATLYGGFFSYCLFSVLG